MKRLLRLLLAFLARAIALPFFLKNRNGLPLMTIDKWKGPHIDVPKQPELPDTRQFLKKAQESLPS